MTVEHELERAGRELVDRSSARQTPGGLRRVHRRRRAARAAVPVIAALAVVAVWQGQPERDASVDVIDATSTTLQETPVSTTAVDDEPVRIEAGHGPSRIVAADGTTLTDLDDADLVPDGEHVALAVVRELLGEGTGAGSAASVTFTDAGLPADLDDAVAVLADAGLTIETTIEPQAQRAAVAAVEAQVFADGSTAALWSIDPRTGATRAMTGPGALIRRAAGGAIWPAIMAVLLESGVSADELLPNPRSIGVDVDGFTWEVQNPANSETEPVTLADALASGVYTPWVGLVADGRANEALFTDVAARFGFAQLDPSVVATVLGTFDTDVVEVVEMTAAFATDGSRPVVHVINQVRTPDGRVLFDRSQLAEPASPPVVEPATVDAVRAAMSQVVCCGTGQAADLDDDVDQIGAAGTTPGVANAWFTGATPNLATTVWVGALEPVQPSTSVEDPLGGTPARIWATYTTQADPGEARRFPR